jgi:hypothetical protein
MPGQQLALLALEIEQDECLLPGQRLAHPQHTGFQWRVVAVVGAVAGDESSIRRVRVSASSCS